MPEQGEPKWSDSVESDLRHQVLQQEKIKSRKEIHKQMYFTSYNAQMLHVISTYMMA